MKQSIIIIPLIILLFCGCRPSNKTVEKIVMDWIDNEIIIPQQLTFQILDDTINYNPNNSNYKVINYIDSTGCTGCKMKLPYWNKLINDFKAIPDVEVDFISIVHTSNASEIINLLKLDNYLHPVAIDTTNLFEESNTLPPKELYHTFLLDGTNKILAVGNPVLNPKIKDLYKRIITSDIPLENFERIESKSLGAINREESISTFFTILNYDTIDYHIQSVIPSCHCVKAIPKATVIHPGTESVINVTFDADSLSGSFTRYVDVFYEEKDFPYRLIIHGFQK